MGPGEGRARAAEVHQGDAARHRGEDQPRAARQRGDPHEEPARQVSCDWWRAGHVTTVLTSDWLSGAGGEREHILGAAHREEEGEAVRQRAPQVSELNVRDSLHNI